ncbi:hypothetical protein [Streptomyces sp. NPDC006477]|uniref:hypothetical protein n=1 Tax=Streptomyces sp. NPDC006477 TaxID=3364747 RepID=UPI003686A714
MGTQAKVYLNPSLPIVIEKVHRHVYLPDGSQHLLDENDRPLFTAPASAGVVVVMEYAVNEDPSPKQVAAFARPAERQQKTEVPTPRPEAVTEKTQPIRVPSPVVPVTVVPVGSRPQFPNVAEFRPPQQPKPGDVRVQSLADRPSDTTGEMVRPDFLSGPSSTSTETGKTSEHGTAVS